MKSAVLLCRRGLFRQQFSKIREPSEGHSRTIWEHPHHHRSLSVTGCHYSLRDVWTLMASLISAIESTISQHTERGKHHTDALFAQFRTTISRTRHPVRNNDIPQTTRHEYPGLARVAHRQACFLNVTRAQGHRRAPRTYCALKTAEFQTKQNITTAQSDTRPSHLP